MVPRSVHPFLMEYLNRTNPSKIYFKVSHSEHELMVSAFQGCLRRIKQLFFNIEGSTEYIVTYQSWSEWVDSARDLHQYLHEARSEERKGCCGSTQRQAEQEFDLDSLTLSLLCYAHRAQIETPNCMAMPDEQLIVRISLFTSKAIRYDTSFT